MLSEFIKAISEQAVKANGIQTFIPPVGAKRVYGVRISDGSIAWRDAEPESRQHKVFSVSALVEVAERLDIRDRVLWYYRTGAVLIVDDLTRFDRVTLPLEYSQQLKSLSALEGDGSKLLDQLALLRLLRIGLAECWEVNYPNLSLNISKIKFRRTEDGHAEAASGKASVGKSITAEMSGAGPIPETVAFTVPVFAGHPWKQAVHCDLQVIADEGKFSLTPKAGQIETAVRLGEIALATEIEREIGERAVEIPLHYGQP